ncbi:UDP-3-O-(3-hydroxymyristoyl)glucosamine N-acyltransferase [Helicobacter pylori]|nr:UDP-3-O-(3-hydroxymyristoyl)glucosamine N-acyltransferase [Helicobacter pylori]
MKLSELLSAYSIETEFSNDFEVHALAELDKATPNDISYIDQARYLKLLKDSKAGAVFIRKKESSKVPKRMQALIVDNPHLAFAKVSHAFKIPFFKNPQSVSEPKHFEKVTIMPNVMVGEGVEIGENSLIYPGVVIADGVKIGKNCVLYPRVILYQNTILEDNVTIHAGSVIGGDGFGYAHTALGEHVKIEHVGIVRIQKNVEIGANTAIDRAVFGETLIKEGVKIDNLVQIGHNCVLGEHSIVVSQVGLSGSTTTGRNVVFGGQVGIGGHLHVGEFTQIGGKSAVGKDLPPNTNFAGAIPAMEIHEWHHFLAHLRTNFRKQQKTSLLQKAKGFFKS